MPSRRGFLASSLAFAASLKAAREPSVDFPKDPRKRLSVSTYPFRSFIKSPVPRRNPANAPAPTQPPMSLEEFAAAIPDKFGVFGIEPWSYHFESTEPDYVRGLAQSFQKAGVRVVNIPCDARVQPCAGPDGAQATQATYQKWIEAALILGSPSIRVHLPRGENPDDVTCAVATMKATADYGAQRNIVVNVENDVPTSENPYRVLKVIEAVGSPYFRSLPDFCNSMQINGDPEYNYKALEALFPHAFNISHVKDQESVKDKTYRVDLDRIFGIAKKAGYHGYFSMEWEGEGDPYAGTKGIIATSIKNLS